MGLWKHGLAGTPTHRSWKEMVARCYCPTSSVYDYYGGRGIMVCDRWLGNNGFSAFVADMGIRPGRDYSLDRIDNDGNYEPGNCRWATRKDQARNRRSSRLITIDGVSKTLAEWSDSSGVKRTTISARLLRGVSGKELLSARRL